jgi:hypothetical protein
MRRKFAATLIDPPMSGFIRRPQEDTTALAWR